MQQTIFLLALCGLLTTGSGATAAPPLPRKVSVPVGPDRLTAYLALPEGNGPFSAVLFLHGGRGGIVGGDPQQSAQALAHAGYVALAPLRLQRRSLREELEQTRAALSYLHTMAKIDRDRLAVVGFSRGGLLALMVAVGSDDLEAAVLMAPAAGRGALERALAVATAETPATLIQVAKNDTVQADHVAIARLTERQLERAGTAARLILYPPFGREGHSLFFKVRTAYWDDLLVFLERHLGSAPASKRRDSTGRHRHRQLKQPPTIARRPRIEDRRPVG